MSRFLFSDNSRNFGSCPASSAMRSCRVHTISDSVVPIVFPSNASTFRSVPSLRWLPPSLRFAPFCGTMNGLRQPCNRRRRFVALSTPDSILPLFCVPVSGLRRSVVTFRQPSSLFCRHNSSPALLMENCLALTGSCTTPCLFALVLDPADVCQTVRLRLSHSARDRVTARAVRKYFLSGLDTTAVGLLPTLPHFDCSPRARLASGCSDLLCRAGFGSRRPRRVVKNGFYYVFTSFPPFTGFSCRETP